jgi:hypothetical protein
MDNDMKGDGKGDMEIGKYRNINVILKSSIMQI